MDSTELARDVERLGRTGLSAREFVVQTTALVARRLEFDNQCFLGIDPGSLVPTWAVRGERLPSALVPRLVELEVTHQIRRAGAADRAAERTLLLSAETEGAVDRSPFYRDILRPLDLKHELCAVLRAQGVTWGIFGIKRNAGNRDFEPDEVALLEQIVTPFAVGLRRTLLRSMTAGAVLDDSPAVLVLSADLRVISCSAAAEALLAELADPVVQDPERLPLAVRAVAVRAAHVAGATGPATARVRTGAGQWLTIRGAALDGGPNVAVVIERTSRSDVLPLVLAAHGLTSRESEVAAHVLLGLSTEDVSEVLGISEYTVQDHMKSIFDKTGVNSRKELAARLFTQFEAGARAGVAA